jgi:uncharacterized protein (TIGR03083 family)
VSEVDIYRRSREALSELFGDLHEASLARTVPETPAWTVRDVLGHLVGGAEDHVEGSDEGAPGPAWTAAHVARLSGEAVASLVDRWARVGAVIESAIAADPRAMTFTVHDVLCHEQDVRSALSMPRRADEEALVFQAGATWAVRRRCERDGLAVPEFVVGDDVVLEGSGGPMVRFPDRYEVGRALFGRRSEAQVRAYDWSTDPGPYVPLISFFPFPETDLHG